MAGVSNTYMLSIADVDRHLGLQGQFCLMDWLLAHGFLLYPDYEDWRHGRRDYLDTALQLDPPIAQKLLRDADSHCQALGLCSKAQDLLPWSSHHDSGESPASLTASRDHTMHRQLTQQWLRPQDRPQLDLFMDNAVVLAENNLCEALGERQFERAGEHLQHLTRLNAEHALLGRYQDLVNYGRHMQASPRIAPEQIVAELNGLQQEVVPLAREVLGQPARDYLAFAWRRLAESQTDISGPAADPRLHPSFALAQIPDWPAVRDCLAQTPALDEQPHLLERLALACSALQQHEKALLLWCLLFERHPDHAAAAVDKHARTAVDGFWQNFWDLGESLGETLECAWFSAFTLARQPGLIHHLGSIPPFTHPASLAMIALLNTRRSGGDEIPAREQLKAVSPVLLRLYQVLGRTQ